MSPAAVRKCRESLCVSARDGFTLSGLINLRLYLALIDSPSPNNSKSPVNNRRRLARTPAFHADNTGSNPVGDAKPFHFWQKLTRSVNASMDDGLGF